MQKTFFPTVIALLMLCSATAFAQFQQRSIEITTGYPSFMHSLEYPWISKRIDMYEHVSVMGNIISLESTSDILISGESDGR